MKQILSLILVLSLLVIPAARAETPALNIAAPSAVLMEKETGAVLFEKNADDPGFPASVTKIMTMLLIVDAMESGAVSPDDVVVNAALQDPKIAKMMEGMELVKSIVVKNKLVNLVLKPN